MLSGVGGRGGESLLDQSRARDKAEAHSAILSHGRQGGKQVRLMIIMMMIMMMVVIITMMVMVTRVLPLLLTDQETRHVTLRCFMRGYDPSYGTRPRWGALIDRYLDT